MIQLDVSKIKNIPGEVRRLEMNLPVEPVQSEHGRISFDDPLRLDASLVNEGGTLKLTGFVDGKARLACGRCLDPFSLPVRAEIDEIYYNEAQEGSDPGEEWIPYRGDRLDVAPEVVKAILSVLPMKVLCREECRGLCPKCGLNLNHGNCECSVTDVDPRMEILKKLLESNGK